MLSIRRFAVALAVTATTVLLVATPAFAHVTVDPKEAPAGSDAELTFSAPNEMDNANTTQVQVFFPTDHPIASVNVEPIPGWTSSVQMMQVTTPISTDSGNTTQAVQSVTWTGGAIKPGQFQQFVVSVGLPSANSGTALSFKALQTYDNGQVVRWIDPTVPGQPEPDHPAPILTLTSATGGNASTTAATTTKSSSSDATARTLGIVGVVLGAIGVIVGGGALARSRRTA
ncbi:MAG: YcnI family protein [Actinobacteria bacterium]|nr:YcnI family protein [Actinomycetota bacterium]